MAFFCPSGPKKKIVLEINLAILRGQNQTIWTNVISRDFYSDWRYRNINYGDQISKKRSETWMGGLETFTQELMIFRALRTGPVFSERILWGFQCSFLNIFFWCALKFCSLIEGSSVSDFNNVTVYKILFIRYLFVLIKKYISIFTKRLLMSLMILLNLIT